MPKKTKDELMSEPDKKKEAKEAHLNRKLNDQESGEVLSVAVQSAILETLLDIRDILDERMAQR